MILKMSKCCLNTFRGKKVPVHLLLHDMSKVFQYTSNKQPATYHWSWRDSLSSISYLMRYYWWNVEKRQVTFSIPTLWYHKRIVRVQISLHIIWQKCSHHLYRTTRPLIHATKNRHSPIYSPNTIIQLFNTLTISARYQWWLTHQYRRV